MDNEIKEIFNNTVNRKSYFVMAENSFINNSSYTITEKMVFLSLCTYAGKGNSCFPGQSGIAKNLGITRQTISTTIKSLEKKGGLLVINQKTETNRKTVNIYMLADINPQTGEFVKGSLDMYKCLKDRVNTVKGR